MAEYRAFCHYVTDGDTVDVLVDMGIYEYSYKTIRIEGFDAPEIRKYKDLVSPEEITHGHAAKDYLTDMILDKPVKLVTSGKISLSRIVAKIYYWDKDLYIWVNVSEKMVLEGFAKKDRPYYK